MTINEAFDILGIPFTSNAEAVKKAYRKRALETHPDRGGNSRDFIRVRAAYEIICKFLESPDLKATDIDDEIPIPDELKSIIDQIVREFHQQFQRAEQLCQQAFSNFDNMMTRHIQYASRKDLENFGNTFRRNWNQLICNLFERFNSNCRATIYKYESWFDKTLEEIFDDLYKKQLKEYSKSPRFFIYSIILPIIVILLTHNKPFLYRIVLSLASLLLLYPVYWFDCTLRRKTPHDVRTLDIQLFKIDRGTNFQGSAILKKASMDRAMSGITGMALSGFFSSSSRAPVAGLAIGFAIAEIYNRIKNPTSKIRNLIYNEYREFLAVAQPEITTYVIQTHQKLMNNIQQQIINSYSKGMKRTILLVAGHSDKANRRK